MKKYNYNSPNNNKGFSLVELSVVIMIIGIIVAGVTAGKSLINSANLQNSIMSLKKHDTAFTNFKEKYGYLPGDFPKAESIWGTYNSSTNTSGVQNGDGNGSICCSDSNQQETMQSWAQLSKAGLISGAYTGQLVSGSVAIGTTHPASTYSKISAFWPSASMFCNSAGGCSAAQLSLIKRGSVLNFTGVGWWGWIDYQIAVRDAASVDTKIDDGIPDSGNFSCYNLTNFSGVTPLPCATFRTSYNISNGTKCSCQLLLTTSH